MRKTIVGAILAVAVLAGLPLRPAAAADTETQARGVLSKLVNYIPNVALDFVDIFEATVAIGPGNGIDLRATRLLEVGFSDYSITRYGLNGRHDAIYSEEIDDGGVGLLGFVFGELDRCPYEIGLTGHLVNVGLDASVNLYKALDLGAGILFLDIEGDNKVYF